MTRATLKEGILIDNDGNGNDVYEDACLFNESGIYVWRIGGLFGDEVGVLPKPKNVAQAKIDFISTYPKNSEFKPKASWI